MPLNKETKPYTDNIKNISCKKHFKFVAIIKSMFAWWQLRFMQSQKRRVKILNLSVGTTLNIYFVFVKPLFFSTKSGPRD